MEEEDQRGVAHFVEHLAFRATANFSASFEVVKFLESVGVKFGACQNAHTSFEETVFSLHVPTDDPGLLQKWCACRALRPPTRRAGHPDPWDAHRRCGSPVSLHVLHEWAFGMRVADSDVEAERPIVLEEWRNGKNAQGRSSEAYYRSVAAGVLVLRVWALMAFGPVPSVAVRRELFKGTLYADRMPIGLPRVINEGPPDRVRPPFICSSRGSEAAHADARLCSDWGLRLASSATFTEHGTGPSTWP